MSKPSKPTTDTGEYSSSPQADNPAGMTRRGNLQVLGLAMVAVVLGIPAALFTRSCVPNALYETPRRVKLGALDQFAEGATFVAKHRVFVFREASTFHCISARCTHLGCTVQLSKIGSEAESIEFHCPCHGSQFHADGTNFAGPAPRPLDHYKLELAPDDGKLVLNSAVTTDKEWRLTV